MTESRFTPPDLGAELLAFCEQTRTVVWMFDVDRGEFLHVSSSYEELWGRPVAELYQDPRTWQEGVHPDDLERVLGVARAGQLEHDGLRFRVRRPDGRMSQVHSSASSLHSSPEDGRRLMGLVREEAEPDRRQSATDRALLPLPSGKQAAPEVLRRVIQESGACLAFLGQLDPVDAGRVQATHAWSAAGPLEPFAYELAGTPCEAVFRGQLRCHSSQLHRHLPGAMADALPLPAGEAAEGYLGVPLGSPAGSAPGILVAILGAPIAEESYLRVLLQIYAERLGAVLLYEQAQASLSREVEERTVSLAMVNRRLRTSQERYRVFVQRSSVGIWCLELPVPIPRDLPSEEQRQRISKEARVVECNDMVALRLGRASGAEVRGMALRSLPTFWPEEGQLSLLETVESGYDLTDVAREVTLPSGSTRHLRVDLVPIREGGGLVRLWCTERDVTERVRDLESFAQQTSRLMDFSRLNTLGEMSAGIAHELNQPLAAIVNYAHGCTRRLGSDCDEKIHIALAAIAEQADRAGESLKRLRGFTATTPQDRERCSISELLRGATQLITHRQRSTAVELELDFEPNAGEVMVDVVQIEQVMVQLLRNAYDAVEASDATDRRVTIRLESTPPWVQVTVRDRGPGLTPIEHVQAFDPFFSNRAGGVGLGLTVSRSMIEAHGGRLWHASTAGFVGAAFCFTLPGLSVKMST